jgi:Ca2+-binding RTX toxin-like protein
MVYGGLGTDLITTGGGNDGIYFGPGRFDPLVDRVNGGTGTDDQMALDGDYTLTLEGTSIQNIDVLALLRGKPANLADYNITIDDTLVGAGATFVVWGTPVQTSLIVDGSGESDGDLRIYGGSAGDALTGGDGDDWIWGGLGADTLEGGNGADVFYYENAAQSSGANVDTLIGVDATEDRLDLPFAVTGFAAGVANTLSFATLGGDLEAAVTVLGNHQAVLFTANAGDMSTRTFLIVDVNGTAGYQHGSDFLIEVNTASPIEQVGLFI